MYLTDTPYRRSETMAKPIPKKLVKAVLSRDGEICQYCGRQGANIHHIVFGCIGRRRIHIKENLITLCLDCHRKAHSSEEMREWTYTCLLYTSPTPRDRTG